MGISEGTMNMIQPIYFKENMKIRSESRSRGGSRITMLCANISSGLYFQFSAGITSSTRLSPPPGTDRARWMAYIINCLIILHLQDRLKLTPQQREAVYEVSVFGVFFYAELWFRAPFVTDSAPLDLHLWKMLPKYEK